jgi:hypothetical protein
MREIRGMLRPRVLLVALLGAVAVHGQDSTRTAPKWALDLYLGGGGSVKVTARTGPAALRTIDLAGWFHLGAAFERRLAGPWSGRFAFGYESGGWEATGPGNPYAAPKSAASRWAIGTGAAYKLHRGARSQFNLQGGARFLLGMRVPTTITLDSANTPSKLRDLTLRYRPSVSPALALGWRWRPKPGSAGCIGTSIGVGWFHCTYDGVELPNDVTDLPDGLLPMTGTHAGWQLLFTIGFSGWSPN